MARDPAAENPFSLRVNPKHRALGPPARLAAGAIERVLGLRRLNQIYRQMRRSADGRPFPERVLETLRVKWDIAETDLRRVPRSGPVVVVANHPFGAIEGVLLAALLQRIRGDVRVLANYLLARIPECATFSFFVDPFGGPGAASRNIAGMKESVRWVRGGGLLVIFPSGEVSRADWRNGGVREGPWTEQIARIIRRGGAGVVPVYIAGGNSPLFHIADLLHPRLGTVLLPRELVNKQNRSIRARIGRFLPFEELNAFAADADMVRYVRFRMDMLASCEAGRAPRRRGKWLGMRRRRRAAPVAPAVDPALVRRDIAGVPAGQTLVRHGSFRVLHARAEQIPHALAEIARLREITFRAVGEGTGRPADLDAFDRYYLHLVLWDEAAGQIAGAYRMGLADEILADGGVGALYTSTLFKFRRGMFDRLGPAIELGRSFVSEEYQRGYLPLLLLWHGIGAYVAEHPKYRYVFGAVSISNDFKPVTRRLIVRCLERARGDPALARQVRPRRPLKARRGERLPEPPGGLPADVPALDALVGEMEEGRNLPVLLRQYLKMGARILAFNVDPDFNCALDALVLVDLPATEPALLARHLGRDAARRILARR